MPTLTKAGAAAECVRRRAARKKASRGPFFRQAERDRVNAIIAAQIAAIRTARAAQ